MDKEKYLKATELASEVRSLESTVAHLEQVKEEKDPSIDWVYDAGPDEIPESIKRQFLSSSLSHFKHRLGQAQKEFEAL